MSIFKTIKDAVNASADELTAQVGRYKNKKFMDATVAICVCISMASNSASEQEKEKMLSFINESPELKVFSKEEILTFFNMLTAKFAIDNEIGKGEAMKYILRLKGQPDAAQLAIRVGIAVAKSDGYFDEMEKESVREICAALYFNPADFQI